MKKEDMNRTTLFAVIFSALGGCAHPAAPALGSAGGRLALCPNTPNCVSSQAAASDAHHRVEPLAWTGTRKEAQLRLRAVVEAMPRARVVAEEDGYLRAEFTSGLWKFVDDLELVLDAESHSIDVRSASRQGSNDLGVNRARVEELRRHWRAASGAPPERTTP